MNKNSLSIFIALAIHIQIFSAAQDKKKEIERDGWNKIVAFIAKHKTKTIQVMETEYFFPLDRWDRLSHKQKLSVFKVGHRECCLLHKHARPSEECKRLEQK